MLRLRRKGTQKGCVIETVELLDRGGSESNTRFLCRKLLTCMTAIVQERADQNCDSFPTHFTSSKNSNKKRKRSQTQSVSSMEMEILNWGKFPLWESLSDQQRKLVTVIGVGSSSPHGEFMLVEDVETFKQYELHCESQLASVAPNELLSAYDAINESERRRLLNGKPPEVQDKYWDQRYRIFSRFDRGIRMDEESWFSATYECFGEEVVRTSFALANANRVPIHIVWDVFSGCGGTAIPFCRHGSFVTAVDIDNTKLEDLIHNASIYEAEQKLECLQMDVWDALATLVNRRQLLTSLSRYSGNPLKFPPTIAELTSLEAATRETSDKFVKKVDLMVLCPPWGGPDYIDCESWDLQTGVPCGDGYLLIIAALAAARNIVLVLPRNTSEEQISEMAKVCACKYFIQELCLNKKCKLLAVYMGHFAQTLPPIPSMRSAPLSR